MKWKYWSGILILFVIVFTITKDVFIILRVEVAANQLSMLLKLFGKLLGTRADPKEKKGGQKMFRGKKEQ